MASDDDSNVMMVMMTVMMVVISACVASHLTQAFGPGGDAHAAQSGAAPVPEPPLRRALLPPPRGHEDGGPPHLRPVQKLHDAARSAVSVGVFGERGVLSRAPACGHLAAHFFLAIWPLCRQWAPHCV